MTLTAADLNVLAAELTRRIAPIIREEVREQLRKKTVTFRTKKALMIYLDIGDRRTIDRMVQRGQIEVLKNGHYRTEKI